MRVSISPFAPFEVIFQIGIGFGDLHQMTDRRRVKGSSSQIGVDDHPGRINHPAEPGLRLKIDLSLKKRIEVFEREKGLSELREIFFVEDVIAHPSQSLSDGFDHDMAGMDL
jgi:hypothetical protein